MRITMAALGTRGDVQPMIAFGRGLRAAGHDVSLIAGSNFERWVGSHGLRFVPSVDMEALMASEKGVAWAESGSNPMKQVRMMRELMTDYGQGMVDPIEASAAASDLLISSFSAQPLVQAAAEDGPAPVYIGFGSMSARDPRGTLRLILHALARARQRAVIAAGWGDLGGEALPPTAFLVKSAPHDWLFPRVSAVVHHGGAGTTAAGLRAGRPTMVIPHMADQPYWGRRVHEMGAGVAPVARHTLTAEALAGGLRRLAEDARIRERATRLGELIRAERGVEAAVAAIADMAA